MTVLMEVEGILNSKPLGYVSSDIADSDPITPNLLLMGRRDASLPQAVYGSSDLLGRRRWKHSQVIADHFWGQFTRRYLPNLQLRQKWQKSTQDIAVGQVVMVIDSQLPRAMWPIGKVTRVIPSSDGRIRVAEVNIKGNSYTRPVAKLIELPKMPDDGCWKLSTGIERNLVNALEEIKDLEQKMEDHQSSKDLITYLGTIDNITL
ncbi:hypothetical protein UPYG_G00204780 [Umbra pygmaea]|uniref:DUF5641 domain-containing protein n=1 Tax=Umbra pygmaea TaxID=75934 RepID=A0ABD0WJC3_UMBPY